MALWGLKKTPRTLFKEDAVPIPILMLVIFMVAMGSTSTLAGEITIYLKGGVGTIRADRVWEQEDKVCYERRGDQNCIPKSRVGYAPPPTPVPARAKVSPEPTAPENPPPKPETPAEKPIVAKSRPTMAPPEPFSLAECLVTGKGTQFDYRNRLGSYGRQDTWAWRRQQCESAQFGYKAQLRAYEQGLKRQER